MSIDPFRKNPRHLTPEDRTALDIIKGQAEQLLEVGFSRVPAGREKAIAITKLEEAVMWAVKGVTG